MKRILLIIVLLYPLLNVAQTNIETNSRSKENTDSIKTNSLARKPKFRGDDSDKEFNEYIKNEIKYPTKCIKNKIEGEVYVEFVIDTIGKVYKVKLLRSSGNKLLDKEALRVIQNSPNWESGFYKGNSVCVKKVVPVRFKLN